MLREKPLSPFFAVSTPDALTLHSYMPDQGRMSSNGELPAPVPTAGTGSVPIALLTRFAGSFSGVTRAHAVEELLISHATAQIVT